MGLSSRANDMNSAVLIQPSKDVSPAPKHSCEFADDIPSTHMNASMTLFQNIWKDHMQTASISIPRVKECLSVRLSTTYPVFCGKGPLRAVIMSPREFPNG